MMSATLAGLALALYLTAAVCSGAVIFLGAAAAPTRMLPFIAWYAWLRPSFRYLTRPLSQ